MHRRIEPRIKLALIYGSTREGRLCDAIAGWAAAQIEGDGPFDLDIIDPPCSACRCGMRERA
jgi:NAD(P)H-dependent FMN reductase